MEETEINKILEEYVLYLDKEAEETARLSPEEEFDKFYISVERHISRVVKETEKTKSEISKLLSIEKISELNVLLRNTSLDTINNLSTIYEPVSLKEQRLQIKDKYPSFTELSNKSVNNGFIFSCSFKLTYKDFNKSIYHEFIFDNVVFKVIVDSSNPTKIPSISTNSCIHPYLSKSVGSGYYFGDKLRPLIKPNLNNYYFSIVDGIVSVLSSYDPALVVGDIFSFIGNVCSHCKKSIVPNSNESGVYCAKTKKSIHRSCAKVINGYTYSPEVVKTCSKCKKDSLQWVNNGAILCGKCLDE